jgi:hypothetical protein
VNYNKVPIPSPDTRSDLTKPVIYWTPIIAPGNLMFYKDHMFPQWKGSAFISGLASEAILRITFDANGGAKPAERWHVGSHRIRDVEVARTARSGCWRMTIRAECFGLRRSRIEIRKVFRAEHIVITLVYATFVMTAIQDAINNAERIMKSIDDRYPQKD